LTDEAACIAFVAGEASGDLLAAPVIEALQRHCPPYRTVGIAGEQMIAAGCSPWYHVRELSVRGYVEVLRELPRLIRLRRTLALRLRDGSCSALVGVDSPDFNLALEKRVRRAGVATVHYVSPSIWAWRGWRIERIRQAADRVLLVFPFEQSIYDRVGIPATYVGHPLASAIAMHPDRAAARERLGVAADKTVICVMPGSRRAEIQYIGPVFFAAAQRLADALSNASFIVPVADVGLRPLVEQIRSQICRKATLEQITLVDGRSHDCLEASDGALVASGTATLEAALYKRPMVIAYRVPVASAWIMRRIGGYLPWIGLPNILAGEALVPELLQEEATPKEVAEQLLRVLGDERQQRNLEERFCAIHESLRRDTPALATEAILDTISQVRTRRS